MRVHIGQYSKRFLSKEFSRPLVLGGVIIDEFEGLNDQLDGDVVAQSLCQAIGSCVGYHEILKISKELIENDGITDSLIFLERCLCLLKKQKISQISVSIEAKHLPLLENIANMQKMLSKVTKVSEDRIGITLFDSQGLSDVSCGDGIACVCLLTLIDQ